MDYSIQHIAALNTEIAKLEENVKGYQVLGFPLGDGPYNGYVLADSEGNTVDDPQLLALAAQEVDKKESNNN